MLTLCQIHYLSFIFNQTSKFWQSQSQQNPSVCIIPTYSERIRIQGHWIGRDLHSYTQVKILKMGPDYERIDEHGLRPCRSCECSYWTSRHAALRGQTFTSKHHNKIISNDVSTFSLTCSPILMIIITPIHISHCSDLFPVIFLF